MFEITKNRNLLSIRLYETQRTPYTLDINTGVFLGQQGKPIKTVPKYWNTNIQVAKDSDNEEKLSWAEQARMRANKTANSYNEYMLKNSYVWNGNVPIDIANYLPPV